MRRTRMRKGRWILWIGVTWLAGCAPLPLAQETALATPAGNLSFDRASAQLRFQDANGRLRALRLLEDPVSIQLDAQLASTWPSFLDAHEIGSGVARRTHEAPAPGVARSGSGIAVSARLPGPSLDSPGIGW